MRELDLEYFATEAEEVDDTDAVASEETKACEDHSVSGAAGDKGAVSTQGTF